MPTCCPSRKWIAALTFFAAARWYNFGTFVGTFRHGYVGHRQQVRLHQADSDESAMVDTIWSKGDKPEASPEREAAEAQRKQRWEKVHKEKDPDGDLFVSKNFHAKRLARVIKNRMQLSGRAVMRVIGDRSTNHALKAIAMANEMLQGSDLKGEQVLGAVLYFKQVKIDEQDDLANVLFLECKLLPRPRLEDVTVEDKQILATGTREKMPKMAAALKNRLRENAAAVVLGMGPRQLHLAVKAILQAGRFLREDEGEEGDGLKVPAIAVMPAMQEFAPRLVKSRKFMKKGEDDPVSIGMRLECIDIRNRWAPAPSEGDEDAGSKPAMVAAPWESQE
ncbi:unnamed protein product [Symbiodinium necroappetens]|uniref:Uncharacterized protein n=1 Tax=Symbiodinium necroappetens TaxID=1628268 RepID=A0A812MIF2_9DINO|nr:unnamed protein product [Symbiodinium necroappetens]